ncbi:MAG TPA: hypothetical protein VIK52_04965, partial [Opitutaceae bacterium]
MSRYQMDGGGVVDTERATAHWREDSFHVGAATTAEPDHSIPGERTGEPKCSHGLIGACGECDGAGEVPESDPVPEAPETFRSGGESWAVGDL